jgi:DNA-binding response OmpR family regulator
MRILLVEDEFLVRDTIAEDLRDRGYTVIEAVAATKPSPSVLPASSTCS